MWIYIDKLDVMAIKGMGIMGTIYALLQISLRIFGLA